MPELEDNFLPSDVEEGRLLAILAYIPFVCLISYFESKDGSNEFLQKHARQGIALFLIEIAAFLCFLLWEAVLFLAGIVCIVSIVFVILGKFWEIPLIDKMVDKFNL